MGFEIQNIVLLSKTQNLYIKLALPKKEVIQGLGQAQANVVLRCCFVSGRKHFSSSHFIVYNNKNRSPAHAPQLTYYIKSSQFFSAVFQVSLLSQLKKNLLVH